MGGLDPAGRVGIVADARAIAHCGAQAWVIASALTAQGSTTFASEPVGVTIVLRQLEALLELGRIHAVKLGMIPNARLLMALAHEAARLEVPLVVDPVVRTSKGEPLSALSAQDYLAIARPNVVLTPNAAEAEWLLEGRQPVGSADQAELAARALAAHGFGAVVVKGGHLRGEPVDVVVTAERHARIEAARAARSARQRGTGCRHASALAAHLAQGESVFDAAEAAHQLVERYLRAAPAPAR